VDLRRHPPEADSNSMAADSAFEEVSLESIASFRSGEGISVARLSEETSEQPVPVYGGNGIAGYTDRATVTRPTIVIGRVGQRCGEVYLTNGPAWISDNALYPKTIFRDIDIEFLGRALQASNLNASKNRNDLPLITQTILKSVRIRIPRRRVEQEAISTVLSEADALVESLERLLAKKRKIKQGALQALLTGEMRLPGFSKPWVRAKFGDVASPRKERAETFATNTFSVELEDIEQGTGRICAAAERPASVSLKTSFRPGDVLFGKLRAYLRKYWLADRPGVCSTEIWALVAKPRVLQQYLLRVVQTATFIDAASTTYGTHMPRSDWQVVKNYELLLPPKSEQEAVAALLGALDEEICAIDEQRAKFYQIKEGMMQQLVTGRIRLVDATPAEDLQLVHSA